MNFANFFRISVFLTGLSVNICLASNQEEFPLFQFPNLPSFPYSLPPFPYSLPPLLTDDEPPPWPLLLEETSFSPSEERRGPQTKGKEPAKGPAEENLEWDLLNSQIETTGWDMAFNLDGAGPAGDGGEFQSALRDEEDLESLIPYLAEEGDASKTTYLFPPLPINLPEAPGESFTGDVEKFPNLVKTGQGRSRSSFISDSVKDYVQGHEERYDLSGWVAKLKEANLIEETEENSVKLRQSLRSFINREGKLLLTQRGVSISEEIRKFIGEEIAPCNLEGWVSKLKKKNLISEEQEVDRKFRQALRDFVRRENKLLIIGQIGVHVNQSIKDYVQGQEERYDLGGWVAKLKEDKALTENHLMGENFRNSVRKMLKRRGKLLPTQKELVVTKEIRDFVRRQPEKLDIESWWTMLKEEKLITVVQSGDIRLRRGFWRYIKRQKKLLPTRKSKA